MIKYFFRLSKRRIFIKTEKTYLKGKDAPLEDTILKIQTILEKQGFNIVEKSKLNPVSDIWSVHISEKECPVLATNGKGNSYKAALASALAEFVERVATKFLFADFFFGENCLNENTIFFKNEKWFKDLKSGMENDLLTKELYSIYNFEGELDDRLLIDFNTGNTSRGIASLPFIRVKDNRKVYFPVSILNNLYVSNGMAAGNTKFEAYDQALCEIIERFVKKKVIKECLSLPVFPEEELIQVFPGFLEIHGEFLSKGFDLIVYDCSLGGKYPVICAVMVDKKNNTVLLSFGCHLNVSIAIERTLTELLQGRDFKNFSDLKPLVFDKDLVSSNENLIDHFINSTGYVSWEFLSEKKDYEYYSWNNELNNEAGFKCLCDLIQDEGYEIFISDIDFHGFNVCRIVIPGFSEIYPISDLVYNNISRGLLVRDYILNFKKLNESQCINLLNEIEEEGFSDFDKVANISGVLADSGSAWEFLTIGDIKLSMYLFLGRMDDALFMVEFLLNNFSYKKTSLYKCINTLLEIKINNSDSLKLYEDGIIQIYGDLIFKHSHDIVNREELLVWEKFLNFQEMELHNMVINKMNNLEKFIL